MREKIEPVKHIVDIAHEAMENRSVTPVIEPIRGGTDGSQLSYKGLPTPNIFTGGENFHGKYEFISVENMLKASEVIVEIARLFEEKHKHVYNRSCSGTVFNKSLQFSETFMTLNRTNRDNPRKFFLTSAITGNIIVKNNQYFRPKKQLE